MVFTNIGLEECLPIGKGDGLLHRLPPRVLASSAIVRHPDTAQHSTSQDRAAGPSIREKSANVRGHRSESSPEINPANTMEMWPNKQTEERANGLPNQQRFSLTVQKMHQNIVTDEGICGT